jgi:hypothetical protein
MNKYNRTGLICLGFYFFEFIEGLATRSHVVTFPAAVIFFIGGWILVSIGDGKNESK